MRTSVMRTAFVCLLARQICPFPASIPSFCPWLAVRDEGCVEREEFVDEESSTSPAIEEVYMADQRPPQMDILPSKQPDKLSSCLNL